MVARRGVRPCEGAAHVYVWVSCYNLFQRNGGSEAAAATTAAAWSVRNRARQADAGRLG